MTAGLQGRKTINESHFGKNNNKKTMKEKEKKEEKGRLSPEVALQ